MNRRKLIVLLGLLVISAGIMSYVLTRSSAQGPSGLDPVVSDAILTRNHGSYLAGECQGEGHFIMDSSTKGRTVTAYVLAMYGEYGFEDGNFVKVSGSGVIPTVITFSTDGKGSYSMLSYQEPEDGAGYAASCQKTIPLCLARSKYGRQFGKG